MWSPYHLKSIGLSLSCLDAIQVSRKRVELRIYLQTNNHYFFKKGS